jgi:hypothetical protein
MTSKPIALLLLITVVSVGAAMFLTQGSEHANDITIPFFLTCFLALFFLLWSERSIGRILFTVTIGYVIASIVKISVDLKVNPTSHNLFPFEVLISGFVGIVAALIGSAIGMIYKWFRKKVH